jgi:hypothetical protein
LLFALLFAPLLAPIGLLACGASQAAKDVDAGFRRIQLHEARIERADRASDAAQASPAPQACAEACEAGDEARAAADGVCAEARALDDADARARCERAGERSAAITAPTACRCRAEAAP